MATMSVTEWRPVGLPVKQCETPVALKVGQPSAERARRCSLPSREVRRPLRTAGRPGLVLVPLPAPARAPLRLTRRGRLTAFFVLAAIVTACLVALAAPSSGAKDVARPARLASTRLVVVRAGDTVWSVAARAVPSVDPRVTAARIERLNHLRDDRLVVGQPLVVPTG